MHKPVSRNYRLVKQGTGPVLIPPGVAGPDVAQRTFTADVVRLGPCPSAAAIIEIGARKTRLLVTVSRNTLVQQSPGWLSAWTAELEAQGCLAPGGGLKLAEWIAESLPLAPDAAFHLLHSNPGQTGQVDLGPHTRLQVVSPILRDGAPPDTPLLETVETAGSGTSLNLTAKAAGNVIGYERAWYAVWPKANGVGFTIAPLDAEQNIEGKTEHRSQPAKNYFPFPDDAAFYRLFYKADQTEFTALVVAARTRADLERRTKTLETGAASCEKLNGELCVAIPKNVGVNPLLAVTVNGSEVMVPWGATVGGAIRKAEEWEEEKGREAAVLLPRLAVSRLYHGRPAPVEFDRGNPEILRLILTGGETISWK
jgi:hypothetical protein